MQNRRKAELNFTFLFCFLNTIIRKKTIFQFNSLISERVSVFLLLRLEDTNLFFLFVSSLFPLGLFHGKRNFPCGPRRNPAILGEHVTALSCSPENSPFFPSRLSLDLLRSVYLPFRVGSSVGSVTPAAGGGMTDFASRAQLVERLRGAAL